MKKRRKDYGGCSVEPSEGRLRLRLRVRDADGRERHAARAIGSDTPGNRIAAHRLAETVRALLRAGRTLAELDPILETLTGPPEASEQGGVATPPLPAIVTVRAYYKTWIARIVEQAGVRPALLRDYRRHGGSFLDTSVGDVDSPSLFGDLPLTALRPKDIHDLVRKLLARPRMPQPGRQPVAGPISVKYVRNIVNGTLRAMIRSAMIDDLVTRDLFVGLTWPTWHQPEADPFTVAEVRRILDYLRTKAYGFAPLPGSLGIRRLPHPAFHAYAHTLFWTGLRPSEASGLQWQDVDLARRLLHVRRSYHSHAYGEPKTKSARRTVELLPETVRILRALQPLHVAPDMPVFTSTTGAPIEPKAFSEHWYDCLRALGLRVRGLYCTKDTYVSLALQTVRDPWWVEKQTGVALATLKAHYAKWMPDDERTELHRLASVDPSLLGDDSEMCPRLSVPGMEGERAKLRENPMRGGGLEPPRVLPH